ncbi:hypothetical protein J3R82DRAFT_6381 [Butyriboletus roseoflavus]|nr:hypothetical protein J3R82DRAFT_6381 [Butyriboletus roseoflavus]
MPRALGLHHNPNTKFYTARTLGSRFRKATSRLGSRNSTEGNRSTGEKKLYHWAIFIPTSTRRGHVVHNRHAKWDKDDKGTHLVGYVAPSYLEALETHLSLVPIQQGRPEWNCQTWVVEALKGLNHAQMYAVQMDYGKWVEQMEILEAAWNVGDA